MVVGECVPVDTTGNLLILSAIFLFQRLKTVLNWLRLVTYFFYGEKPMRRFAWVVVLVAWVVSARATVVTAGDVDPGGDIGSRDPAEAVSQLDVHVGLEVKLFASEPMIHSVSNIDIDHRGRVWVCDVVNYRRFNNEDHPGRKEGDRILILEDMDGDGKADRSTVFYQGSDIDSAHGVCVLPTPNGQGAKAIVSAGANVLVLTDRDGDDRADKKELLFTGIGGAEHDHGIHAFVFGPDGKLYFNFGNMAGQIKDKHGGPITDGAGNVVQANRNPYQEGMVFRCDLDGGEFETLGWNFRNNWMVTVDSFGTLWQSDNDDDGSRGTRINYVMEFGNYGFRDELTGAEWKQNRTGMSNDIPTRHWHQNDPGVVPNLLQTGAGSPTGITVYEGNLLPATFHGQIIHCDPGPNVCRAYYTTQDGAGYQAEIANVLHGARDNWFRPSDVSVAPGGSLLVADWYDPGVGGHRAGDLDSGRIFLVAPPGHPYVAPKFDFSTPGGAIEALKSPNFATRYMAWTALHGMGSKAEPGLLEIFETADNQRHRARALWLLGKMDRRGEHYIRVAIKDANPDIRIVGVRLARQLKVDLIVVVRKLVRDPAPQVRRELAIALRHNRSPQAAELWVELAMQHDGHDRWYLEALGIAADRQWDAFFAAWLKKVGDDWSTAAGRDIIWRSRSKYAPEYLAKIIINPETPVESHPRYLRAFDFHGGPEKDKALRAILGL